MSGLLKRWKLPAVLANPSAYELAGDEAAIIEQSVDEMVPLELSPDGKRIAAGSFLNVRIYDVETRRLLAQTAEPGNAEVRHIAFSSDGTQLLTGNRVGDVVLYQIGENLEVVREYEKKPRDLLDTTAVFFDPQEENVFAVTGKTLYRWDKETGELKQRTPCDAAGIGRARLTPGGKVLMTLGSGPTFRFWQIEDGKQIRAIEVPSEDWFSIALSPNGRVLARGFSARLKLMDVVAETEPRLLELDEFEARRRRVLGELGGSKFDMSLRFSPDGKVLAAAGNNGGITLWDVENGKRLTVLEGHAGPIVSLLFTEDGKQLISGSTDQTIRFWDVAKYSEVKGTSRTWSDVSGKFSVTAELVRTTNGSAILRKENGKLVRVPLARLAADDQKFAESHGSAPDYAAGQKTPLAPIVEPKKEEPKVDPIVQKGIDFLKDSNFSVSYIRDGVYIGGAKVTKSLTDEDLKLLPKVEQLRYLHLDKTDVTDEGMTQVGMLTDLKSLKIDETFVTDEGIKKLSKLAKLTSLDLTGLSVTDESLKELHKLPMLDELDLDSTDITDEGLKHLVACQQLKQLNLCNTAVTDDGLKVLAELPRLRYLLVGGSKITEEGIKGILEKKGSLNVYTQAVQKKKHRVPPKNK